MSQQIYLALDPTSQAVYNTSTHRIVAANVTICNSNEVCSLPENVTDWEPQCTKNLCQGNGESTILGVVLGIFMTGIGVVACDASHYLNAWCCPPNAPMAGGAELVAHEPVVEL